MHVGACVLRGQGFQTRSTRGGCLPDLQPAMNDRLASATSSVMLCSVDRAAFECDLCHVAYSFRTAAHKTEVQCKWSAKSLSDAVYCQAVLSACLVDVAIRSSSLLSCPLLSSPVLEEERVALRGYLANPF